MKRRALFLVFLFAVSVFCARAQQSADTQYLNLYNLIQEADGLADSGNFRQALDEYTGAQTQLQQFQNSFPDWNPAIVTFRLKYLAGKIADLTAQLPPPGLVTTNSIPARAPNAASDIPPSIAVAGGDETANLRAQLAAEQSENSTLLAKLKEALNTQPTPANADGLARTQEHVLSLMKENDLLRAGAAERHAGITADTNEVIILLKENDRLKSRLAVDEAQASPYTPEELALFKQAAPPPAAAPPRKKSTKKLPAGSAALVAEAQSFFSAQEYDKAEAVYLKILEQDPENALVLGNLAAIEMQQGNLTDAEKHLQTALAQDPDDAFNLSRLGLLKFRQGKYDEALDSLSRAAKLDPQNPEIQNYLGVTLGNKGLRSQAEAALRKAIELNPNYADAQKNLAAIYISATPPLAELARWHYQKAIEDGQPHDPAFEKALAEKGAPVSP